MKHMTNLAHIALYTKNLDEAIAFYRMLGGVVEDRADIPKPAGVNHLAMVSMPGFFLELIEPHDGTNVTAQGGVFPHIAIEVDDIGGAVRELRTLGVSTFRTEEEVCMPELFGGIRNIFFTGVCGELLELVEHIKP